MAAPDELVTRSGQPGNNNLLLVLRKYAHQQDENFTTATFVHLLRHFHDEQPEVAISILNKILGPRCKLTQADLPLRISSQIGVDGNQPDICVESRDDKEIKAFIEVKVEQPVDWVQIKKYADVLENDRLHSRKCLALLTRDLVDKEQDQVQAQRVNPVRWHEVARAFREELKLKRVRDPASVYLTKQLLEFLSEE